MSTETLDPAKTIRTIKVPRVQYRNFQIEVEQRADGAQGEVRLYPLSFSSEAPVRRFSWDTWEEYDEVLSHDAADVNLDRAQGGLPLIKSHQRLLHFGTVGGVALDARKKCLRGDASFSSIPLGQEQETMLREGHIRTVSVGYQIDDMALASKDKTGYCTYRCKWTPFEVSTEPIPADPGVGFGRSLVDAKAEAKSGARTVELVEFTIEEPSTEGERTMSGTGVVAGSAPAQGEGIPAQPAAPGTRQAAAEIEVRDRGAEAAEIMEMAQAHGCDEQAVSWVRQGLTPDQVRKEILAKVRTHGPGQPASESLARMPAKDRSRYSVHRAIRLQTEIMEGRRGRIDGLEAEIHQELIKQRTGTDHGGILVPWRIPDLDEEVRSLTRTLGTTQATGGATLVPGMIMPEMIDLLRNKALVLLAGAKLYPGLNGPVYFNKKTGAPTVSWMDENPASAVSGSEPSLGYVSLSPKTLIGQVQIPRQLLVMSSIDVEADTRNDLAMGHGLALDRAALHGKGTDKQPVGLYSAADVLYKSIGGVPDLEDITGMPALMADKNADLGAQSWMTTPLMAGVLMRTQVVSGQAKMLWEGTFQQGTLGGYMARATNQMSKTLGAGANEHGIIHGNWNDLLVGMWGNDLEIVVDVVTRAGFGQVVITSYSMGDIVPRRPESFVKGTGATIS